MADEAKPSVWKVILAWVGGASAVIGLFAAVSGQLHVFEGSAARIRLSWTRRWRWRRRR